MKLRNRVLLSLLAFFPVAVAFFGFEGVVRSAEPIPCLVFADAPRRDKADCGCAGCYEKRDNKCKKKWVCLGPNEMNCDTEPYCPDGQVGPAFGKCTGVDLECVKTRMRGWIESGGIPYKDDRGRDLRSEGVKAFREIIERAITTVRGQIENTLSTAKEWARLKAQGLLSAGSGAFRSLLEPINVCLGSTVQAQADAVGKIAAEVGRKLGQAVGASAQKMNEAKQKVVSVIEGKATSARNSFNAIVNGVQDALNKLKGEDFEKTINDNLNALKDLALAGNIVGFWNKARTFYDDLKSKFKVLSEATTLNDALTGADTRVRNWWEAAKSEGQAILDAAQSVGNSLTSLQFPLKELGKAFVDNVDIGVSILKCIYDLIAKPAIDRAPTTARLKLPSWETIEKTVRQIVPLISDMARNLQLRGKQTQEQLENIDLQAWAKQTMDNLLAEFVKNIPKVLEHFDSLRSETRVILTLDGLTSPDDERYDPLIHGWIKRALAPVREPFERMVDSFPPMKAIRPLISFGGDLAMTPMVVMIRQMVYARSIFMEIAKKTAPFILRGAVAVGSALDSLRLPPCVKDAFMKGLSAAFEVFGGGTAILIEALDMKDTTVRILDAILGALDSVKSVRGDLKKLAGNEAIGQRTRFTSAKDVFAAWEQLKRDNVTDMETLKQELERRNGNVKGAFKNAKAARDAAADLIKTEAQKIQTAMTTAPRPPHPIGLERVKQAIENLARRIPVIQADAEEKVVKKFAEANTEMKKALSLTAAITRLDPDKEARKQLIYKAWEGLSEAFFKLTWDTFFEGVRKFNDVAVLAMDELVAIAFGIIASVLGVFPCTTDWGPFLSQLYQIYYQFVSMGSSETVQFVPGYVPYKMFLSLHLNVYMGLIVPELRTIFKDQLVDLRDVIFSTDQQNPPLVQRAAALTDSFANEISGFKDILTKSRDRVALGTAAFMTGPIGDVLSGLPPDLVALIQRAVTSGVDAAQKIVKAAGRQIAITAGTAFAVGAISGAPPDPEKLLKDAAGAVMRSLRAPLIEFFIGLLPDESPWVRTPPLEETVNGVPKTWYGLKPALEKAIVSATAYLNDPNVKPEDVFNLLRIVKAIGDALVDPALVGELAMAMIKWGGQLLDGIVDKLKTQSWQFGPVARDLKECTQGLRGLFENGIKFIGTKLQEVGQGRTPSFSFKSTITERDIKLENVLAGGFYGILREIVLDAEPFVTCMMLRPIQNAELKNALKASISKAFKTFTDPAEIQRIAGQGWRGILAKVIEIAHAPIIRLFLQGFPDGRVKTVVTTALLTLGDKASNVDFIPALMSDGGLLRLMGEILKTAPIPDTIAEEITGGLANVTPGGSTKTLKEQVSEVIKTSIAGRLGASQGAIPDLKRLSDAGLKAFFGEIAAPMSDYLIAATTNGITNAKFKTGIERALQKGLAELPTLPPAEVIVNGAGSILKRLKSYFLALRGKVDHKTQSELWNALDRAYLDIQPASLIVPAEVDKVVGHVGRVNGVLTTMSGYSLPEVTP